MSNIWKSSFCTKNMWILLLFFTSVYYIDATTVLCIWNCYKFIALKCFTITPKYTKCLAFSTFHLILNAPTRWKCLPILISIYDPLETGHCKILNRFNVPATEFISLNFTTIRREKEPKIYFAKSKYCFVCFASQT